MSTSQTGSVANGAVSRALPPQDAFGARNRVNQAGAWSYGPKFAVLPQTGGAAQHCQDDPAQCDGWRKAAKTFIMDRRNR